MTDQSQKEVNYMIAISTAVFGKKTRKVHCPECRSRICDLLIPEQEICRHDYKIVFDGNSDCLIAIKCQKCGKIIGLGIKQ